MSSRSLQATRKAIAASYLVHHGRPGPAGRGNPPGARLWVTRHQRGLTHVHPSGLPLACAPGWNGTLRLLP